MKYTVQWTQTAERFLAEVWLDAADRDAVTRAAHALDQTLRNDAHLQGESREGNVRILFESPLAAHVEVLPDDRTAFVLTVWTTRRP
jgi:plasmid stabilization system protein ParE